jgi:hypothetical protein
MDSDPHRISIYSNGCTLIPYQLKNGKWGWVVSTFEDDCYFDGERVNVNELWCDDRQNLIGLDDNDEE